MAIDQRNLPANLAGDADFRTWAQGIAAQLAAVGLVQTADTGQVNLATAARPLVNAFAGYQVYRFADTLQATQPMFLKVEYGVGATVDRPALAITIGTTTNGAGVIGGQTDGRRVLPGGDSKVAGVVLPSYCSGGPGRIALFTNIDAAAYQFSMGLIVERTRGADGVVTAHGLYVATVNASNWNHRIIPFTGAIPAPVSNLPALPLNAGGVAEKDGNVALSAHMAFLGTPLYALPLAYFMAAIPELATFQVNHLGALRTYLPLGDSIYNFSTTAAGNNAHSLAIPWE